MRLSYHIREIDAIYSFQFQSSVVSKRGSQLSVGKHRDYSAFLRKDGGVRKLTIKAKTLIIDATNCV